MSSFGIVSKGKYLELEKENKELRAKITALKKKIEDLNAANTKAVEETRKIKARCKELEGKFMPLKTENSELRTKVQGLIDERTLFQKLIRELTDQTQRQKK